MVLSVAALAATRPRSLRLTTLDVDWVRLDAEPPDRWRWEPFPTRRNRFDTPQRRVRYAARTERGAFRERYGDRARVLRATDAGVAVVRLTGRLRVVDLRNERVLDALGADAEISTGRSDRVLAVCSVLAGRLLDWYGEGLHGLVYTSRTTPQTSANLAFFAHSPVHAVLVGTVRDREEMLDQLVVDDGFRIDLPGWV